jgi:hypothetical protein
LRRRRSEAHASPDCYSLNDGGVAHKQRRRFILSSVSGQASLPIAAITMVEAEWLIVVVSAISPTLLLLLVLKRWLADVSANQAQD